MRRVSLRGSAIRNLGGFILRHDPLFSRAAASLQDTKDQSKNRPSQRSRHNRLGLERFEDRVADEIGKEIRGHLVAAFFDSDGGLIIIFLTKRDVDRGKDFGDRAFAGGGGEFLVRRLLKFHELDRSLHDDMGIDRMHAGMGGAEQLEGFVVTLLTAQERGEFDHGKGVGDIRIHGFAEQRFAHDFWIPQRGFSTCSGAGLGHGKKHQRVRDLLVFCDRESGFFLGCLEVSRLHGGEGGKIIERGDIGMLGAESLDFLKSFAGLARIDESKSLVEFLDELRAWLGQSALLTLHGRTRRELAQKQSREKQDENSGGGEYTGTGGDNFL